MKRLTHSIADGQPATIASATEMIRCCDCGIKITPASSAAGARPDDVVTYQGRPICVRCGLTYDVVVRGVGDA